MKSAAVVAALLMSLLLVQGCGTLGHPAAGTDNGVSHAITVSTLDDGSTRIVVSTDAAFDYGSVVLRPAVADDLMRVAKPHLQEKATISGYTDNVGAAAYNLTLSRDRAQSIANALMLHGASAGRLSVAGHGEDSPRSSNETEAGRELNRRVELLFESLN
mgnify:FL=1